MEVHGRCCSRMWWLGEASQRPESRDLEEEKEGAMGTAEEQPRRLIGAKALGYSPAA